MNLWSIGQGRPRVVASTLELSNPFANGLREFPISKPGFAGTLMQQLRLSILVYPELWGAFRFVVRIVLGALLLPTVFAAFTLFCAIAIFTDSLEHARASRWKTQCANSKTDDKNEVTGFRGRSDL